MRGAAAVKMLRRAAPGLFALLALAVLTVSASANAIHAVEMEMVIHRDGSASMTERWDITMDNASNSEWYVAKHNLDNMEIADLAVRELFEDGSEAVFETLGRWDVDASRADKAGRCGLVRAGGGYEICWGFGELGRHRYEVTYTLDGAVKGYEGGDAVSWNFLSDAAGGVDSLTISIRAERFKLVYPKTRVWVFGYEAESEFLEDGGIEVLGQGRFRQSDYAVVLLAFEPGQLSPADRRGESLEEIIELNMAGSVWEDDQESRSSGGLTFGGAGWGSPVFTALVTLARSPGLWMMLAFIGLPLILRRRARSGPVKQAKVAGVYANVDYCRELPFGGSLPASFARLSYMNQIDDGAIIGCYLLGWVRSGQVEIMQYETGIIRKRQESAIKLYAPRSGMEPVERQLYDMIVRAAGSDGVLQSREFERWARRNHGTVGGWYASYRGIGNGALDQMGAYGYRDVPVFFGLSSRKQRDITPLGEDLTRRMFGFLRYLQDFTIINEREVREVELWDQYLVYAQLFGIADQVAGQFQQLYPAYFTEQNEYNHYGHDTTDILIACHISSSFSRSMHAGYRAGVSAASSGSSSSGGGGSSSSSGGGGGSSGGGGAGGR